MSYKVFISHSMDEMDQDLVDEIEELCNMFDIDPYIAENRPKYQEYISEKIKKYINDSDILLAVYTELGSQSKFVNQEIGYAEGREIPYIILKEKGVSSSGFFYGKDVIEYDPYDEDDINAALNQLINYLDDLKTTKMIRNVVGIGLAAAGAILLYYVLKKED